MNESSRQQEHIAMLGLFGIGILLLVIAIFFDPIGSFPDTGLFDLGTTGTKWLLGALGAFFLVGGLWCFVRTQGPDSR